MAVGIYQLSFPDGSAYIGSSVRLSTRIAGHRKELRDGTHKNNRLVDAYRLFGEVKDKTLLVCRSSDLIFYEQLCIDKLAPTLNISRIAGRICWRPETRKKLSETKKALGQRPNAEAMAKRLAKMTGSKASLETRFKMAAARLGKKRSAETIKKMSISRLGLKPSDEARARMSLAHKGQSRPHTPESKAKLAAAQTGRKYSLESREKMRASRLAWLAKHK